MYMCRTRIFDKHIARQGKNGEKTSSIWIWIHYFWGTSLNFGFAYRLSSSLLRSSPKYILVFTLSQ